ncbi:hypothetical protein IMCC21224_12343 [Puniceibacterium sp. IMCC21224]|nr:hypothetical protein IMCC21224_12343 [Puniceibacterium sp. IMCC21224]
MCDKFVTGAPRTVHPLMVCKANHERACTPSELQYSDPLPSRVFPQEPSGLISFDEPFMKKCADAGAAFLGVGFDAFLLRDATLERNVGLSRSGPPANQADPTLRLPIERWAPLFRCFDRSCRRDLRAKNGAWRSSGTYAMNVRLGHRLTVGQRALSFYGQNP